MPASSYNPFSLEGKTILVTGASSGIGRATAIECSRMGATVVLSSRNVDKLNETLSMMDGTDHIIFPADLAREEEICAMAGNVPMLNGVVCVAGISCLKPIRFYSSSAVESTFAVNTFASMYIVRSLLKEKKISDGASLVFMSSIASTLVPSNVNGLYCASKAALDAFSRQCSLELANKGVRSNLIQPGLVRTNLLSALPEFSEENCSNCQNIEEKYTLLKRIGCPEEIAWAVVYLLSDASSYITGSSIVIDGGYHINFY